MNYAPASKALKIHPLNRDITLSDDVGVLKILEELLSFSSSCTGIHYPHHYMCTYMLMQCLVYLCPTPTHESPPQRLHTASTCLHKRHYIAEVGRLLTPASDPIWI